MARRASLKSFKSNYYNIVTTTQTRLASFVQHQTSSKKCLLIENKVEEALNVKNGA